MNPAVGKEIRTGHLFHATGKTFVVAFDHGLLMGPIKGLEDIVQSVSAVASGRPDAIQVTPPVVGAIRENFSVRGGPALVARIDVSNVWRTKPEPKPGYYERLFSVKDAVRVDADAVVTYLLMGFSDDRDEGANLRALGQIAEEAMDYGMPLIIEPLGIEIGSQAVRDEDIIRLAVRVASEVGADILKVDYTGSRESFAKVVNSTFVPLLVRGGPKTKTLEESFQMVEDSLQNGAQGIVFGRNVWQASDPKKMTEALTKLVHGEVGIKEAVSLVEKT